MPFYQISMCKPLVSPINLELIEYALTADGFFAAAVENELVERLIGDCDSFLSSAAEFSAVDQERLFESAAYHVYAGDGVVRQEELEQSLEAAGRSQTLERLKESVEKVKAAIAAGLPRQTG